MTSVCAAALHAKCQCSSRYPPPLCSFLPSYVQRYTPAVWARLERIKTQPQAFSQSPRTSHPPSVPCGTDVTFQTALVTHSDLNCKYTVGYTHLLNIVFSAASRTHCFGQPRNYDEAKPCSANVRLTFALYKLWHERKPGEATSTPAWTCLWHAHTGRLLERGHWGRATEIGS
jgi:hypothetical protein